MEIKAAFRDLMKMQMQNYAKTANPVARVGGLSC